ncbi:MAG: DsbA family protein [Gaiellales bacterium]
MPIAAIRTPLHVPFVTGSDVRVEVVHFTDAGCPWAYSAEPAMRALEARYGDQLVWRTVMIGLTETYEQYVARGYTGWSRALTRRTFARYGMPFSPQVLPRPQGTGRACRAAVAAGLQGAGLKEAAVRALRFGWFAPDEPLLLDTNEALERVLSRVEGLDVAEVLAAIETDEVEALYHADFEEARNPDPLAVKLNRCANTDGRDRYTAPSLVLRADDGRESYIAGFQPFETYEVALMNLEPRLTRLPVPDVDELVAAYPGGLTTMEVARALAETTAVPDPLGAERALVALVADGAVERLRLGDDAIWRNVAAR